MSFGEKGLGRSTETGGLNFWSRPTAGEPPGTRWPPPAWPSQPSPVDTHNVPTSRSLRVSPTSHCKHPVRIRCKFAGYMFAFCSYRPASRSAGLRRDSGGIPAAFGNGKGVRDSRHRITQTHTKGLQMSLPVVGGKADSHRSSDPGLTRVHLHSG